MTMLITGRTIQGIGGGGVTMLVDLIVCDLVPLRDRGTVMGIIFGAVTIGTALGPFLGGIIVESTTWHWVFYLNLPVGAVAMALLLTFLHVRYEKESSLMKKFKRVDFMGNSIFTAATTAMLIALTNGGTIYSWSSWRIIFPLAAGFTGLGRFYIFEVSKLCVEPTLPPQLFANRTSASAFALTFVHTLLMYWEIFFLPVYFQAILGISAVVFNNQFVRLSMRIGDSTVRNLLSGGQAYEHATGNFVNSLRDRPVLQHQVLGVYTDGLKLIWQVAIGISGLGFLLVVLEKEVKLRTELETKFGMVE